MKRVFENIENAAIAAIAGATTAYILGRTVLNMTRTHTTTYDIPFPEAIETPQEPNPYITNEPIEEDTPEESEPEEPEELDIVPRVRFIGKVELQRTDFFKLNLQKTLKSKDPYAMLESLSSANRLDETSSVEQARDNEHIHGQYAINALSRFFGISESEFLKSPVEDTRKIWTDPFMTEVYKQIDTAMGGESGITVTEPKKRKEITKAIAEVAQSQGGREKRRTVKYDNLAVTTLRFIERRADEARQLAGLFYYH